MPKSTASITKTRSGKFRVKYYAANGEMLACSEELKTKASAQKNVRSMRKLMAMACLLLVLLTSCASPRFYVQDTQITIRGSRGRTIPFGPAVRLHDTVMVVKMVRRY